MDDIGYNDWKEKVNNDPSVIERGEAVMKTDAIDELTKQLKGSKRWNIIKDVILLFLLATFILVISFFFLFPENYQGLVQATHICTPNTNITNLGDINNNNFTCNNTCNANFTFPDEIIVNIVNGSL